MNYFMCDCMTVIYWAPVVDNSRTTFATEAVEAGKIDIIGVPQGTGVASCDSGVSLSFL